MSATVNVSGNSIVGSVKGESYGVAHTPEKYQELVDLAKAVNEANTRAEQDEAIRVFKLAAVEDFSVTMATACPNVHVNKATGKFYLKADNGKVSKHAIPKKFVNRILESVEKGIDVTPLIKFWTRLLRNPNFTHDFARLVCGYVSNLYTDFDLVEKLMSEKGVSHEVAVERATGLQTPITNEGLLVTYKVSREIKHKYEMQDVNGVQTKVRAPRYVSTTVVVNDVTGETKTTEGLPEFIEDRIFEPAIVGQSYDAFYCGSVLGHIIKVGERHYLENWNQVDCRNYISAVKGLHVGNLDYIDGFRSYGETHNVFVDPMYIGAVTNDGTGALRVKEYFVYDSFAGVCRSIYHSSTYAAMTDAAWEVMRQEAIEETNKKKAEVEAATEDKLDVNA